MVSVYFRKNCRQFAVRVLHRAEICLGNDRPTFLSLITGPTKSSSESGESYLLNLIILIENR